MKHDPFHPNIFHQCFHTYTMTTTREMQPHLIGVTIIKSLQEVLQSDLY